MRRSPLRLGGDDRPVERLDGRVAGSPRCCSTRPSVVRCSAAWPRKPSRSDSAARRRSSAAPRRRSGARPGRSRRASPRRAPAPTSRRSAAAGRPPRSAAAVAPAVSPSMIEPYAASSRLAGRLPGEARVAGTPPGSPPARRARPAGGPAGSAGTRGAGARRRQHALVAELRRRARAHPSRSCCGQRRRRRPRPRASRPAAAPRPALRRGAACPAAVSASRTRAAPAAPSPSTTQVQPNPLAMRTPEQRVVLRRTRPARRRCWPARPGRAPGTSGCPAPRTVGRAPVGGLGEPGGVRRPPRRRRARPRAAGRARTRGCCRAAGSAPRRRRRRRRSTSERSTSRPTTSSADARGHVERAEHVLGRGQRRAAGEARQRPQPALVVGEEQVVAPGDRRRPGARRRSGRRLVGSRSSANRSSSRRAISCTDSDLHPGGGQLDGQRQAVEGAADLLDDRGGLVVEHELPRGARRPAPANSATESASGSGSRPWTTSPSRPSGTWLVASTRSARRGVEQPAGQRRPRRRRRARSCRAAAPSRRRRSGRPASASPPETCSVSATTCGDRAWSRRPRRAGPARRRPAGSSAAADLDREPGLADAGRPDDGHQPVVARARPRRAASSSARPDQRRGERGQVARAVPRATAGRARRSRAGLCCRTCSSSAAAPGPGSTPSSSTSSRAPGRTPPARRPADPPGRAR